MPSNSRVLDVGCSTGYLGELLRRKGCTVVGIEVDQDGVATARSTGAYAEVYELNLDDDAVRLPNQQFDVVLCADILEHLRHPDTVLRRLCNLLSDDGCVVVSLPNVAHLSIRVDLLRGKFTYTDTGILDRTHLHFYTYRTAMDLVQNAGLRVDSVLAGSNRFGDILSFGPRALRMLRGPLAFSIVLIARRESG